MIRRTEYFEEAGTMEENLRDETREAWDSIAEGYDQLSTPRNMMHAEECLRRLDVRPGLRFLDVAAGTGAMSIPPARRGADVLALDISPEMIERLNARARAEGLSNLQGQVMDGHNLELEDDTFDISASFAGIMLFPDLPQGLRELVRVTKPGGRAMIVSVAPPQKLDFFTFFIGALQTAVPDFSPPPSDPPPLPFQVSDPEVLRQRMVEAGLAAVEVDVAKLSSKYESGKHLWDFMITGNPFVETVTADLTAAQRTEAQQVLDRMVRERAGGESDAVLDMEVNIGIGTK